MSFKSFQEYLNDTGKMIEKPAVKVVAGYEGETPTSPEKTKKDPNAGGAKDSKSTNKPYKAGTDAKNPNKAEKGFAHEGDSDLKYEPTTNVKKSNYGGDEVKSWLDSSSVTEWLNKTRNLSGAKFVSQMRNETIGTSIGQIKETVNLCENNSKNIQQLIFELKRHKLLGKFITEACKHGTGIKAIIAEIKKNTLFQKAINEMSYMSSDNEDGMSDDEYEPDMSNDHSDEEENDMSDEDEYNDEDSDDDDDEDEYSDEDEMSDEDSDEDEMSDEDSDEDEMSDEDSDEDDSHKDDDSALSDPFGGGHASHALRKMGPRPEPSDEF